jgi:hypothetical protein
MLVTANVVQSHTASHQDGITRSHRRENLKSYKLIDCNRKSGDKFEQQIICCEGTRRQERKVAFCMGMRMGNLWD